MRVASPDSTVAGQPVLACHKVQTWLGDSQVLFDVDAQVGAGEVVALLGGNGSGKTTLVRTVLGLVPHHGGSVELFGTRLKDFHQWHRLGYVPQRGRMQATSAIVREVASSGRLSRRHLFRPESRTDKEQVSAALERVGIKGLDNQPLNQISGGQQQRALIARALAGQTELLIMDEPLSALDIPSQRGLAKLFSRLKAEGLAMLVVLHELGPMENLIDRSILLRSGQKVYDGPLLAGPPTDQAHHHPANYPKSGPLGVGHLDTRGDKS